MSVNDQDVQQAFQNLFSAHRAVAESSDMVERLKSELAQAESDLERNQRLVVDLNAKINGMAKRAAGAPSRVEDEPMPAMGEFRPLVTR
jgi:hypothetical protein